MTDAKQISTLRIVLDSEHSAEERKAAAECAKTAGTSLSTLCRRLLRKYYRQNIENADPRLFADLSESIDRDGQTIVRKKQRKKKRGKSNEKPAVRNTAI